MKVSRIFLMYSIVVVVVLLFVIKASVQDMNKQIAAIDIEIAREMNDIRILKAEFAYLTKPNNIESLSNQHLNLHAMRNEQVITIQQDKNSSKIRIFEGGKEQKNALE